MTTTCNFFCTINNATLELNPKLRSKMHLSRDFFGIGRSEEEASLFWGLGQGTFLIRQILVWLERADYDRA